MTKPRNPEYDKRDLLFVHACEKCARAFRCSFKSSKEGPESVCRQLIEFGTYNCESCLRGKNTVACTFSCTFFVQKRVLDVAIVAVSADLA